MDLTGSNVPWWQDTQSVSSQAGYYAYNGLTGAYPSQANPMDVTPSSGYESPDANSTCSAYAPLRGCSCGCMDHSSGSGGVVSLTLNCNVQLGTPPNSSEHKVSPSTQCTIEYSPGIVIAPKYGRQPVAAFASLPDPYCKDSQTRIAYSAERDYEARSTPPEGGRLTPATLSANQEILEYLAPHLQVYLNPMALLPYLQKHALVDLADVDYICNPHRTDDERRWRILRHAPYKDPGAFSRFAQCLSEENAHPGHKYLARRLHEAMERKRTNPFKRLGSIRTRLYTDETETEEMGYIPYPPQRLPTYPPANTTTSMTATPRHTSSASGQQNSMTTTSSEDSEVFSVVYGAEHSSHSLAVTPYSTWESLRGEHQRNPPPRPQTPTPYSEYWSGVPNSIDDDCQLKQSVYYRPPTPYSTRGSDHDELEDTEWQQDNTQIPCRPQTPTAYTDPNSSTVDGTPYPKSSTERTRHKSGRPGGEIKRPPSEMKEKHSERKLQWLQEKVQFSECSEEVVFTSRTHYDTEREILYSGILHEHGKPRFVVLFSDMLLVLKVKKQGKSPHMEWFADQEYSMKTPLLLHFLTIQRQAKKTNAEHFSLHYQHHSRLVEICLKACSKEAKAVWVHELSEAIKTCTAAHAATILKTGSKVSRKPSGRSYTKLSLTVFGARQLNLPSGNHHLDNLYCAFTLGKNKCRTQGVQGWPYPMWNFKCEFSDFTRADTLHISVYSVNTYQPDDLLGFVEIPLDSIPAEKLGLQVLEKQLPLEGGPGRISIRAELGWETKM